MATRKTAGRRKSKPKHAYRLLVKLEGSEPTVWRLISVPGSMTLADLDRIIRAAMGWTNGHMHLFAIDGNFYGVPDDEWFDDKPTRVRHQPAVLGDFGCSISIESMTCDRDAGIRVVAEM